MREGVSSTRFFRSHYEGLEGRPYSVAVDIEEIVSWQAA